MVELPANYWAFIPGPSAIHDPPESSVDLQEVATYPPDTVAEAFLGFPGFRLLHDADPSWRQWRAGWERGRSFLVVEMTLFETTPIAWGGSGVSGYCALEELLALWQALREQFSAMWLHNSQCEIHTPESFMRLMTGRAD
jgi:hypothetical protein